MDRPTRFRRACSTIGCEFNSTKEFICNAMLWLSAKYGDLHVEFHEDGGWQVTTCYTHEAWGQWVADVDGTLEGCLLCAIEVDSGLDAPTEKDDPDFGSVEGREDGAWSN